MPHVIIKLWPGRTVDQKRALAYKVAAALKDAIQVPEGSISIAIEEVPKSEWKEKVYDPEIMARKDILYKKPDYSPPE